MCFCIPSSFVLLNSTLLFVISLTSPFIKAEMCCVLLLSVGDTITLTVVLVLELTSELSR